MAEGMTVQELMIHFSNHAYTYGEKVANAEVEFEGKKIDDIIYNEEENKFHVKVEEEG